MTSTSGHDRMVITDQPVITLRPDSPMAQFREGWGRWHTLAALIVTPLAFWFYKSAVATPSLWTYAGMALMALGAAAIAASYLPPAGVPKSERPSSIAASPCGAMAFLFPVFAHSALGSLGILGGIVLVAVGLSQRIAGAAACSSS